VLAVCEVIEFIRTRSIIGQGFSIMLARHLPKVQQSRFRRLS